MSPTDPVWQGRLATPLDPRAQRLGVALPGGHRIAPRRREPPEDIQRTRRGAARRVKNDLDSITQRADLRGAQP